MYAYGILHDIQAMVVRKEFTTAGLVENPRSISAIAL
jgi:hypothetical protein